MKKIKHISDRQRLDWLEDGRNFFVTEISRDSDSGIINAKMIRNGDLRQAIDAAMRSQKK